MIELRGIPASSGLAKGRLLLLRVAHLIARYSAGTSTEERGRLEKAIADAKEQVKALIARLDDEAADILEFQNELLGDDGFTAPAFSLIDAGEGALQSWISAIDREIAEYRSGFDEHFSARADDVADLKERVVRNLLEVPSPANGANLDGQDILLIANHLSPSRFLELNLSSIRGIATVQGSPTSHVSILAKARGIPMVVGCDEELLNLPEGDDALLDADSGVLLCAVNPIKTDEFVRRIDESAELARQATGGMKLPAKTSDGELVRVYTNLDAPDLLGRIDVEAFDGVGLVRTEFMFADGAFPSEDEQYQIYCRILEWAAGRPVTVRALDVGGDKPIKGLTIEGEENPFLGMRGIRLLRRRPDIFRTQFRALARAATQGHLNVMAPMVSTPVEMTEFRAEMRAQVEVLQRAGKACRMPRLGMMVEVPAAALMAAEFDTDFYSIGTNDLIQYTMAVARDEHRLNYLACGDNPAVLTLIEGVANAGRTRNLETSVCGDMASDPAMIRHLLRAGIRALSIAPASVAVVKQAVRRWPTGEGGK
jgi:phosphotransferase system enzyme I (PtsI)